MQCQTPYYGKNGIHGSLLELNMGHAASSVSCDSNALACDTLKQPSVRAAT